MDRGYPAKFSWLVLIPTEMSRNISRSGLVSCWDGDYNQLANRRIVVILSEPLKMLSNALYIGSSIHVNIYGADADFRGRIVLAKV